MTKSKSDKNKEIPAEMETLQSKRLSGNKRQGRHAYTLKEREEAIANGGIITGEHSDGTFTITYPEDEDFGDFEEYNAADYDDRDDEQRAEDD